MPQHGPVPCTLCWSDPLASVQEKGAFRLVRDPGHWGATAPTVLILGISKGNTQSRAFASSEPFEAVAFKGIRHRLLEVLQAVGLLAGESVPDFEKRFTANERSLAFASMVRCSLTGRDQKTGGFTAESPKVVPAFRTGSAGHGFVARCAEQFVGNLDPETRLVVLLGNSDGYMDAVARVVANVRGSFSQINGVAFDAGNVRFVHVAHPSKGNGHFGAFVRGEGTPGRKCYAAREAVSALGPLQL